MFRERKGAIAANTSLGGAELFSGGKMPPQLPKTSLNIMYKNSEITTGGKQ